MDDLNDYHPLRIPSKRSLIVETVDILRTSIEEQRWQTFLPGERYLCSLFRISRPTLRKSLNILAADGLIEVAHGKRTRILQTSVAHGRSHIHRVNVLTPLPRDQFSPITNQYCSELLNLLRPTGRDLFNLHDQRLASKRPFKALEHYVNQYPDSAWLLFWSSYSVQKWFQQQKLPALVVGSCYPDLRLPSIDQDQRATCRHAAGHLLAHGHRHLALVVHQSERAGDKASEEGFLEAIQAHRGSEATGILIKHDGSVEGLKRRIAQMLKLRHRPTGLVVCTGRALLGALPPLYQGGLRIPEDISVICRDDEGFLDFLGIAISRYVIKNQTFTGKLGRLTLQLVEQGDLLPDTHLVTPQFHPGESVAAPPPI